MGNGHCPVAKLVTDRSFNCIWPWTSIFGPVLFLFYSVSLLIVQLFLGFQIDGSGRIEKLISFIRLFSPSLYVGFPRVGAGWWYGFYGQLGEIERGAIRVTEFLDLTMADYLVTIVSS